jgi:hypothetical protein
MHCHAGKNYCLGQVDFCCQEVDAGPVIDHEMPHPVALKRFARRAAQAHRNHEVTRRPRAVFIYECDLWNGCTIEMRDSPLVQQAQHCGVIVLTASAQPGNAEVEPCAGRSPDNE